MGHRAWDIEVRETGGCKVLEISLNREKETKMAKLNKITMYISLAALLFALGYSIGHIERFERGYKYAIKVVEFEFKQGIKNEVPFYFRGMKFIPRKDGAANVKIVKEEQWQRN